MFQPVAKPRSTSEKLRYLLLRLPRLLSLAFEFWQVMSGTDDDIDLYLDDLSEAVSEMRVAENDQEKTDARKKLSQMVYRL